ncbi:pilus assembly protein N-terminal domain-containing protein [Vibrio sp. D404a]|nr:pilus assembly protein N-terminal domain-containing protein [Vibrio sp. D404a]MDK9795491.1 pilus assembly protein N-terminal domain-containing protein [Vibrio sp. D449a]
MKIINVPRWVSIICLMIFVQAAYARVVNLSEGDARSITTKQEIGSVFISDPEVADYQVIDENKVVFFGRQTGNASFMVFDKEGNTIISNKLVVNKSLVHIEQQIALRYPDADVSIYNLGEQAVLSGTVASEKTKEEIYRLTGELLGKEAEITNVNWQIGDEAYEMAFMRRYRYPGVVDNIEVKTTKQVNVKISIAEVSHTFLEEFGIEIGTVSPGVFVDQLTSFSADDIISVITAIGDDRVGQVLAEPNLSVISGETASFLAGGEIPVVTVIDGSTDVEYREYGIRLELMAKVLNDDKIKLSMLPEVSALDNQYQNDNFDLPALKTRRARTTVELGDGQSFVLAGLLSTEEREELRRIPYIGDIPVLGALFRKTTTERTKTELIIVATVNLVQPIHPNQIQLPTIHRTYNLNRWLGLSDDYPKASEEFVNQILSAGGFKK